MATVFQTNQTVSRTAEDLLDERDRVVTDWRNAQTNGPSNTDHPDAWRMHSKREELELQILNDFPNSYQANQVFEERRLRAEEQQKVDAARTEALRKTNEMPLNHGLPVEKRQKILSSLFDRNIRAGYTTEDAWVAAGEAIELVVEERASEQNSDRATPEPTPEQREAAAQFDQRFGENFQQYRAIHPTQEERSFRDETIVFNRGELGAAVAEREAERADSQAAESELEQEPKPRTPSLFDRVKEAIAQRYESVKQWAQKPLFEETLHEDVQATARAAAHGELLSSVTADQLPLPASTQQRETETSTGAEDLKAAAQRARREMRMHQRNYERGEIRHLPGVKTDFQAFRVYYESRVMKLIKPWLERDELLQRAHDRQLQRTEEKLIKEYWKQQEQLSKANTEIPAHLWKPKEWRASQKVREIESELKSLRGVNQDQHVSGVRRKDGSVGIEMKTIAAARESATRREERQIPTDTVFSQGAKAEEPRQESPREELVPSITRSARLEALEAAKELRSGVPVGGWKKPGEKEMYDNIIKQLSKDGVQTVNLTAHYGGNDRKVARDVHDGAIERNLDVIEAVREKGIAVDTGEAKLFVDLKKKTEVAQGTGQSEGSSQGLDISSLL